MSERKKIESIDAVLLIGGIVGTILSGLLKPYNQNTGIIVLFLVLLGFSFASFGTGFVCIIRSLFNLGEREIPHSLEVG